MKTNKILGGVLVVGAVAVSFLVASVLQPVRPVASLDELFPREPASAEVATSPSVSEIVVSDQFITAPRPAKPTARKTVQTSPCAFDFRDQAQGPVSQQVRGFCGG